MNIIKLDLDKSRVTITNEWYSRGIQISLHIRSGGLQALGGGGYFGVNFGHLKLEVFHWGGGVILE